ncbi:hypothetical protein BH23GEM9_BH23GEM9_22250 [soil metagenome]
MIYICIPTHNEQQTVGVVLWKLRQVLTEFPRDYQLLVADDASTDKTTDVLEPYTRVLPLTVIHSDQRKGHAASLEMLLREAVRRSEYPKRDVIVTLQADFSDEPDDVVALIKLMEAGADVAVGIKVSASREPRLRRWSRSLSRFFTRRQTWPEGVVTPFDGYRAYRLYAVKRAIEEAGGRRLLRYDGWAGHAELLRSVLPHARRVEALEVEDRTDRLQRPRREKPFALALQVRAMASGAEPAGLLSVEELERTAATASRSRDRSALQSNGDGRGAANGTRNRRPQDSRSRSDGSDRSRSSSGERSRSSSGDRSRGERTGAEGRGGERPASRQGRGRPEGSAEPRQRRPAAESPPETAGGAAVDGAEAGTEARARRRPPRKAPQKDGEAPTDAALAGDEALAESGAPIPPKKRRRRRRSRSSGEAGQAGGEQSGAEPSADATAGDDGEGGEGGEGGGAGEKKRRRRGGRRGGRGRRKRGDGEIWEMGEMRGDGGDGGPVTDARPAADAGPVTDARPAADAGPGVADARPVADAGPVVVPQGDRGNRELGD